jgi:hypothetical protein
MLATTTLDDGFVYHLQGGKPAFYIADGWVYTMDGKPAFYYG